VLQEDQEVQGDQQVPSLLNVHEVQEAQWAQEGQSYHPCQKHQQIQRGL